MPKSQQEAKEKCRSSKKGEKTMMRLNEMGHTQKSTKVHNVNMIEQKQLSFRKI